MIRAYGRATSEGLQATGIVERKLMTVMKTKIDYTLLGKVENELRSSIYALKEIHYLDTVTVETFVEENQTGAFTDWMTELTNGAGQITVGDSLYLEEEVKQ